METPDLFSQELQKILEQVRETADKLPEKERESFLKRFKEAYARFIEEYDSQLEKLHETVEGLPDFVKSVDEEFEKRTGLTKGDDAFLIFATVLQIIRQIIINRFKERLDDQEAAKSNRWHNEEHSKRSQEYYASIDEMISNPVPFDATRKEVEIKQSGKSPKLSGFNHRYKAIGHDPLLGLIFGTANIMTNTITVAEGKFGLKTYHVHTGQGFNGSAYYDIDKIFKEADTLEVFRRVIDRVENEEDGWKALRVALAKEIVHLLTDVRTSKSLPLPFISLLSPKASQILNYAQIDTLNVKITAKEAALAALINYLIGTIHSWCYDEEKDGERALYEVRTKKIIQYSGELALVSTTMETAVRMYLGDLSAIKTFDFGGSIVTLYNTWNTPMKVAKIKSEYIINKASNYLENK